MKIVIDLTVDEATLPGADDRETPSGRFRSDGEAATEFLDALHEAFAIADNCPAWVESIDGADAE